MMKNSLSAFWITSLYLIFEVSASGQPASVTWNLTAPDSMHISSMAGNITAQDQSLTNLFVPLSGGYSTSSAQRTSAKSGGVDGAWPAESSENGTRYMQFTVAPTSANDLTVSSVSLFLWANSGSGMRANVYYSTDPTFTTRTQIGSALTLGNSAPGSPNVTATPGLPVNAGQTFYLRVYPWYTTTTTGKYTVTKIVMISGSTVSSSASLTTSTSSLSGFSQTVGIPSTMQTYTVSGSGLTSNVDVAPPSGFEISTDGGVTWNGSASPVSLPVSGGGITGQPVTIGVRLNAVSGGPYSGNIVHTSTGVTTANIAVSGSALAPEPTVSSSVGFGTITGNSIVVNFTSGNGSNRVVVAREGGAVSWSPADGNAVVGVSGNFSAASDQGSGNKAIYDGTGSSVTVTGLQGNATYHFAVYDYNVGSGNSQNYNTTSPGTGFEMTLAVPTIMVIPVSLSFGNVEVGTTSAERTYALSGAILTPETGNITVAAPAGFEVSTTSGSGFSSSLDVPYSGGTLAATSIYLRFGPTGIQSYSGNVTHDGGGAITQTVAVTGNGVAPTERNVLQAENGILTSAYVMTQYAGYTGSGYVDIANKTGASLEITFRRATASTDTVRVYYALGASSRVYDVTLNGSLVASPSFTGTGSWTTWSSLVIMVPMQAGINHLKFAATTNASPNANLDRIYVGGQTVIPVYKLVLLKSGLGMVSAVPASADSFYDAGSTVTLTAAPSPGSMFYRWSGNDQSAANPYLLTMNSHKTEIGVMPPAAGFGSFSYEAAPQGFASVGALGYPNGTTGGSGPGSQTVYVTNSDDLGNLMLRRVDVSHALNFPPLTVYVVGTLTTGAVVADMCDVKDVYDISIIGAGVDATLSGFGLNIVRARNIIVRNLKIENSPIDGVTIQADDIEGTGDHIWIDHCTITNCYDGALDVTHTASYVTLSWNHFYNHDKTCLMGHSDNQSSDVAMKVTYHHNYFDSTGQRHPRVRYGKAHVYNNYYRKCRLYGVSSNLEADVVVEGSYFLDVPIPVETSRDASPPGDLVERNNVFAGTTGPPGTRGAAFDPSLFYGFSIDDPNSIPQMLTSYAGSGKYDFSSDESPLPIQLASFTAQVVSGNVVLQWTTLSELNNYGFLLQRKHAADPLWTEVQNSFVPGHGTTNVPQYYSFTDRGIPAGTWQYRLKQTDLDGPVHYSDAIVVNVLTGVAESVPLKFVLHQNFPNPFNPATEIKFSVERTGRATLDVFNVLGQKVAAVFDEVAEAGQHYKTTFDGSMLSSGVYFCRLKSGEKIDMKKLLLLK